MVFRLPDRSPHPDLPGQEPGGCTSGLSMSGAVSGSFASGRSGSADLLDCSEFLRYVYTETLPYADANGIYYHLKLPPQTCTIYCHRVNLFRAFENLVKNATEHTPMEGSMTLSAAYTKDSAEITFKDSGEGIDPVHPSPDLQL